ncbi:DUF1361 domain-containing protein [Anthocerotibacter panamensis]|uniref:DUF1361 domain-containing protein n=1 Tax=Anthocerotibacter panamensis TaxID=2857077 RepID=UPI001C4026F2|nr:DUF1361 domain-containing protein [Anthocerotibacter panamensis]
MSGALAWSFGALESTHYIWTVLRANSLWMGWNLFLAAVPLGLSLGLFRWTGERSWAWWLGLGTFIIFLPNAPYVLTDVIHLIQDIQSLRYSEWVITLVLIPQYVLFFLAGFLAYILSLINLGTYLNRLGLNRLILPSELLLHGLSAVGVYLGRFLRFNSWDLITQPDSVFLSVTGELLAHRPLVVMILTFAIVAVLYTLLKTLLKGTLLTRDANRIFSG